jgi:predicted transcriptional regulator with HTH domain
MPQLSKAKKDKISEQILHFLFSISPDCKFTAEVSREIARDEEFTKSILNDLKQKSLVVEINKNKDGVSYSKRQRWRLSNPAFEVYRSRQTPSSLQQSLNSANFLE